MAFQTNLSHIPVEDVISQYILPYLDLFQIWEIRIVSRFMYRAVKFYIRHYLRTIQVLPPDDQPSLYPALANILLTSKNLQSLSIFLKIRDDSRNGPAIERCLESLQANEQQADEQQSDEQASTQLLILKLGHMSLSTLSINSLCPCLSKLRCLHLIDVEISDSDLCNLLKDTVTLIEFVCHKTEKYLYRKSHAIHTSLMNAIAKQCNLETLELNNCISLNVRSSELQAAISQLSHLKTLKFEFIFCITEHMLLHICEYCRQLKHLEIQHCCSLSWSTMEYLKRRKINVVTSAMKAKAKPSHDHI